MTGGWQFLGVFFNLDSTEVLENMAGTWRLTASLPSARSYLRAASLENNIFVFGENITYFILILNISFCLIMFIMTIYLQEVNTMTMAGFI